MVTITELRRKFEAIALKIEALAPKLANEPAPRPFPVAVSSSQRKAAEPPERLLILRLHARQVDPYEQGCAASVQELVEHRQAVYFTITL